MTKFIITAERSPDWDDAEVRRRLARCYRLILNYKRDGESQQTADRDEFGDASRSEADGHPSPR